MGPLTLGYERWANLPPSEIDLQSFGSASVSESGVLDIKLLGINGDIRMQKTLEPKLVNDTGDKTDSGSTSIVFKTLVSLVVALVGMVL